MALKIKCLYCGYAAVQKSMLIGRFGYYCCFPCLDKHETERESIKRETLTSIFREKLVKPKVPKRYNAPWGKDD